MKKFLLVLTVAAIAGTAGWYAARQTNTVSAKADQGRKILYYQSPMHPWIKSDKPGNCTICGMKLSPAYEGDTPASVDENIVQLSTNSVNVLHVATSTVAERPLKRTIRAAGIVEDDDTRHRILSAYVAGR